MRDYLRAYAPLLAELSVVALAAVALTCGLLLAAAFN